MTSIVKVSSNSDRNTFLKFPHELYADNQYWVAPINMDIKPLLTPGKHSFYEYGEMELFLAKKDGKVVGRIAAILNNRYNDEHNSTTGFFGFFECINDQEVANLLLDTAKEWLQSKGQTIMHGPASPSSNYDYGLLVDAFEDSPRVMMTYNFPYYQTLLENYDLKLAQRLFAYKFVVKDSILNERVNKIAELALKRSNVTLRFIDLKQMKSEVEKIKKIYNAAWESNWGHVSFTEREFDDLAKGLKMIADQSLVIFAEVDGKPIGLAAAVRDYNYIFKQMKGSLFPFNFLKMFTQKNKIKWSRVLILGLLPEYQRKGLDAALYRQLLIEADKLGIDYGEGSWILEDNQMMNRGLQTLGGEVYKTYHIYEKKIV